MIWKKYFAKEVVETNLEKKNTMILNKLAMQTNELDLSLVGVLDDKLRAKKNKSLVFIYKIRSITSYFQPEVLIYILNVKKAT